VLLASDAIHLYDELERRRPFAVVVDLESMYQGYDLAQSARDRDQIVVPGHDPLVAERFPDVENGAAGIALRIA
jgi:glyoxylase-like metal-dependent hydrolase (beta-lactamase superfamily II)